MPFPSESALQKLETFFTKRRYDKPPFWLVWMRPNLLLVPTEEYSNKLLLRVAILSTSGTLVFITVANCVGFAAGVLLFPQFWPMIHDPKLHKYFIGVLSKEGFYWLPTLPLIILAFASAAEWPQRYFWNRRAVRLREEGSTETPVLILSDAPEIDTNTWPPPPRRMRTP